MPMADTHMPNRDMHMLNRDMHMRSADTAPRALPHMRSADTHIRIGDTPPRGRASRLYDRYVLPIHRYAWAGPASAVGLALASLGLWRGRISLVDGIVEAQGAAPGRRRGDDLRPRRDRT